MRRILRLAAVLLPAFLSGCLYTNVRIPRSYRSATPSEVKSSPDDETVTGSACNHSLLFLFAWGQGGYAQAVQDALGDRKGAILYDVKADTRGETYLIGVYSRLCTIVTGRVAKL